MQKAIIAIAVGLIGLTSCDQKRVAQVSADSGPSLEETEKWINDTYNKHDGGSPGYGDWDATLTTEQKVEHYISYSTKVDFKNCYLSIEHVDSPKSMTYHIMHSNWVSNVRGQDINLSSISIRHFLSHRSGQTCVSLDVDEDDPQCDYSKIEFETINKLPIISEKSETWFEELKGPDHYVKGDHKSSWAIIPITDRIYLPHFEKAFKHWLEKCGAKGSPF